MYMVCKACGAGFPLLSQTGGDRTSCPTCKAIVELPRAEATPAATLLSAPVAAAPQIGIRAAAPLPGPILNRRFVAQQPTVQANPASSTPPPVLAPKPKT